MLRAKTARAKTKKRHERHPPDSGGVLSLLIAPQKALLRNLLRLAFASSLLCERIPCARPHRNVTIYSQGAERPQKVTENDKGVTMLPYPPVDSRYAQESGTNMCAVARLPKGGQLEPGRAESGQLESGQRRAREMTEA